MIDYFSRLPCWNCAINQSKANERAPSLNVMQIKTPIELLWLFRIMIRFSSFCGNHTFFQIYRFLREIVEFFCRFHRLVQLLLCYRGGVGVRSTIAVYHTYSVLFHCPVVLFFTISFSPVTPPVIIWQFFFVCVCFVNVIIYCDYQ